MEAKGATPQQIVIDTDIFIDFLRKVPAAKSFFQILTETRAPVLFSALTETELLSGTACNNADKREELLHFLALFVKISVDNPIAQKAGDLRREHSLSLPDSIIAATALQNHAILHTRDKKLFEHVPNITVKTPY